MTIPKRMRLAADDPNLVIGADGLLAAFNDAEVLAPLDVLAASTIGRLLGEEDEQVLLAAALAVRGTRFGHVCIRLDSQKEAVFVDRPDASEVGTLSWPGIEQWQEAIDASTLVGDGTGDEPLVQVDDRLYLQRYHAYEDFVATLIDQRISDKPETLANDVEEFLENALNVQGEETPSKQLLAAKKALTRRFTVMAGGPGTGKTHTIGVMLSALAQADGIFPLVALAAPTGKAAARLGEAVVKTADTERLAGNARAHIDGVEGTTIHRLLGYHPARGRFQHDADNRLPHDLVIVDEMSMVSLPLAARLLSAVRDDARVVLVGDPNQLESIEAGTVLADIVGPSGGGDAAEAGALIAEHVVVLDRDFRIGEGSVRDFAHAVRIGEADMAVRILSGGTVNLNWVQDPGSEAFDELLERVISSRLKLVESAQDPDGAQDALDELGSLAVLAAHHRGPQSVDRWRRIIEAGLDERYRGLRRRGDWYPGQPVMITSNDYGLNLFNGDIGVVVETGDGLKVAFGPGKIRYFPRSQIGDHQTVHAMTIHKSQGSQFEEVVVSIPAESSRLLTRQLLYTAVTRASGTVTVVGDEGVIRQAINRSVERASGLGTRLWSPGLL